MKKLVFLFALTMLSVGARAEDVVTATDDDASHRNASSLNQGSGQSSGEGAPSDTRGQVPAPDSHSGSGGRPTSPGKRQ